MGSQSQTQLNNFLHFPNNWFATLKHLLQRAFKEEALDDPKNCSSICILELLVTRSHTSNEAR